MVIASSASVYGQASAFPTGEDHHPYANRTIYGAAKTFNEGLLRSFNDMFGLRYVALRYFNVYGPREHHKGKMASMVYQLYRQLKEHGHARLFEGTGGFGHGEQRRDFVFVGDVVSVNRFFAGGPTVRGIFNVGTGASRSFNDVAKALIKSLGKGGIEYFPFPESLQGKYQSLTEADISALRAAGYNLGFASIEQGIAESAASWEREDLAP